MKISTKILIALLGVTLVAGIWFIEQRREAPTAPSESSNQEVSIDTSDWETYRNDEYGFSIKHPSDWDVFEDDTHPVAVKFNIYKSNRGSVDDLPYTHHSDATHVSVYPEGVPTEGLAGEHVSSEVTFSVQVNEARDFVLSDGTPFATTANISEPPMNWNEHGFIFARTAVEDREVECTRDGETVSESECDVLMGDTQIISGTINEMDRAQQVAMLESFRLFEDAGDEVDPEEDVASYNDLIRVFTPTEDATVSSPLTVTGEARGQWYFEADFPLRVEDADGNVLGQHYASAQLDPNDPDSTWMTEDYVPFEGEITFDTPTTDTGSVIFEKDNPSGLDEHADEFEIPIEFADVGDAESQTVSLYYYNASLDEDETGNVRCSEDGLVAVEREIQITQTPIQDTVRLLLEGNLTDEEQANGLTTEYPLEGLSLSGASLEEGVLTLRFDDPNNRTSGGSCRAGILWMQIRETVEQFDEVEEVRFESEDLFQP